MKSIAYKFLSGLIIIFFGILVSCGEDEVSPTEKVKSLLTGDGNKIWRIKSLAVDDTDQTTKFTGLTIQFANTGYYATTNGGVMWPALSTWEFTDSEATSFYRADGIEVQVNATETTLVLSLEWTKTTYGGGRVNSISGQHLFKFGL